MELVRLQPRIDRLSAVQSEQERELAELRHRSAMVLERWYTVTVMGAGECWAEWDTRLGKVEQQVKRAEAAKARRE